MRIVTVLVLVSILAGCASTPGAGDHVSPGVSSPANARLDVAAYNLAMERKGLGYYCDSGNCDTLPVLLEAYAPIYPRIQLAGGINGHATVVFDILEDGTTANFKVESASADAFADAALAAVKLWRFRAPTLDGRPVRITTRQSFPFDAR